MNNKDSSIIEENLELNKYIDKSSVNNKGNNNDIMYDDFYLIRSKNNLNTSIEE